MWEVVWKVASSVVFCGSFPRYRDTYKPWIFTGILFMNIWGMLDAILRFPIVHDLDTFFSVKLVLIIGGRVGA